MAAKKKIREQERELIRKEKALAEAAIIITAQKNFCDVSGHQGRLIPEERRVGLCDTIDEGVKQGARAALRCARCASSYLHPMEGRSNRPAQGKPEAEPAYSERRGAPADH